MIYRANKLDLWFSQRFQDHWSNYTKNQKLRENYNGSRTLTKSLKIVEIVKKKTSFHGFKT